MVEAVAIGVASIVIGALIVAAGRWLMQRESRQTVKRIAKQMLCRHDWERIPTDVITDDSDWCKKCDARR